MHWVDDNGQSKWPIVNLDNPEVLKLRFDLIGSKPQYFRYKFVHCNEAFKPDNLSEFDYLNGRNYFSVEYPERSEMAYRNFLHYEIVLFQKRADFPFRISGNYLMQIYEETDEDNILLELPLIVYENKVSIKCNFKRPLSLQYKDAYQQIDIELKQEEASSFYLEVGNFNVQAYQNFRFDSKKEIKTPSGFYHKQVFFSDDKTFLFPGLDEFKRLDLRSLKYSVVGDFTTINRQSYIYLFPDVKTESSHYSSVNKDLNGHFYVIDQDTSGDASTNADYVNVQFRLGAKKQPSNEKIYVIGAFSRWKIEPENEMKYDSMGSWYKADVLIKQGLYDYTYVKVKDGDKKKVDYRWFNQSFSYTDNDYQIFAYYKTPLEQWYRIIGFKECNSINGQ